MSDTHRILLVDDDPLVRSGLRLPLSSDPGVAVAGEAGDGDEVVEAVRRHHPDVALMDLRMPRRDGIAARRGARAPPAPPQVIALTTWDVDDAVRRSVAAGAGGCLRETASPAGIIGAGRAVRAGDAIRAAR